MSKGSGAPKCKLCGKEHWGLCLGAQRLVADRKVGKSVPVAVVEKLGVACPASEGSGETAAAGRSGTKTETPLGPTPEGQSMVSRTSAGSAPDGILGEGVKKEPLSHLEGLEQRVAAKFIYLTDEPPDRYDVKLILQPGEMIVGFSNGVPVIGKDRQFCGQLTPLVEPAKPDRKIYLKLKARERRAAEKLGLTVAQYRARMAKKSKKDGSE